MSNKLLTNVFFLFVLFALVGPANAQWAVYDDEVKKILEKINNVKSVGSKSLSGFDDQALLSEKFELSSVSSPEKYIGTEVDCGDEKLNLMHYNACRGLRNLRLKTLEQTEAILEKIKKRRDEIKALVSDARKGQASDESGQLQRYQFELQGLQAHLQNDAMELEALRYGYKQREKMYEVQMAEARRATDTRPPGGTGGVSINLGTVPFVRGK